MESGEAIFLRIKRRHSEPPIECFNTVPAKRRCLINESAGVAHFKYLGTSSTTFETTNIALEDFKDVGASGERKIILSTKHVAHIVNSFQDAVQCEVCNFHLLLYFWPNLIFCFNIFRYASPVLSVEERKEKRRFLKRILPQIHLLVKAFASLISQLKTHPSLYPLL